MSSPTSLHSSFLPGVSIPARTLPTSWTEYEIWSRRRDGFREWLEKILPREVRDQPRTRKYLTGRLDLEIHEIQELLDHVKPQPVVVDGLVRVPQGLRPTLRKDLPLEVFRKSWLDDLAFQRACYTRADGWSLVPTLNRPAIFGFLQDPPRSAKQLGLEAEAFLLLVLRGRVNVRFLRTTAPDVAALKAEPTVALDLKSSDILLFDGAIPHAIQAVTEDARVLKLLCRTGRPGRVGRIEYEADHILDQLSRHVGLSGVHLTVALRTTIALHRIHGKNQGPERYRHWKNGGRIPTQQEEIRQLAKQYHFSERFFWDFGGQIPAMKFDPTALAGLPDTTRHISHGPAHEQRIYRAKELLSSWDVLGRIGRGPHVGIFEVYRCDDWLARFPPVDHHDLRPGAALMFVLGGRLHFAGHPRGDPEGAMEGEFGEGDALTFTSQVAHTFGNGEDQPARLLHVRWPFTREQGLYS